MIKLNLRGLIKKSALRFIDTMSMHVACSGFCNEQRELYFKSILEKSNDVASNKFQRDAKPVRL